MKVYECPVCNSTDIDLVVISGDVRVLKCAKSECKTTFELNPKDLEDDKTNIEDK